MRAGSANAPLPYLFDIIRALASFSILLSFERIEKEFRQPTTETTYDQGRSGV